MKRTKEMQTFVDNFTEKTFGRTMKEPYCVICGSELIKPDDFKDDLSRTEFDISHMCQMCQDKTFGPDCRRSDAKICPTL